MPVESVSGDLKTISGVGHHRHIPMMPNTRYCLQVFENKISATYCFIYHSCYRILINVLNVGQPVSGVTPCLLV